MKKQYGVVHGMATCQDCGWFTQTYKNAQATAAIHARVWGHHVTGELGIYFSYIGDNKDKQEPTP